MELSPEVLEAIDQQNTATDENIRRRCTRLGYRLGGVFGMMTSMGLGMFVTIVTLFVMSMFPFWGALGTQGRLDVMDIVLLAGYGWFAIQPFVFFKLKYALIGLIATVAVFVLLALISGGLNSIMMTGVHLLLESGVNF